MMVLRNELIPSIVKSEYKMVRISITDPALLVSLLNNVFFELYKAKAYAIAPLRPAIHITNFWLRGIASLLGLKALTKNDTV